MNDEAIYTECKCGRYVKEKEVLGVKSKSEVEFKNIPKQLPDIKQFIGAKAIVKTNEIMQIPVKFPNGCIGYKAVVEGKFEGMALYAALEPDQSVYLAEFEIEFNEFFIYEERVCGEISAEIDIEEVEVTKVDARTEKIRIKWCTTVYGDRCVY